MADVLPSRSKCEEQASWSDLPPLGLEKMYSFLSRMDRVNMSLVSPNWSHGFESPSLWKSVRFNMTYSALSKDKSCSLMKCVDKYSKYFKHVNISFERHIRVEEFSIWSEDFKTFLQILANTSQIVSMKFVYPGKYSGSLDPPDDISTSEIICSELDHFFGSQRNLQRLELYNSYFKHKDGVKLLKGLLDNCKKSLKTLVLHDFFTYFDDFQFKEMQDHRVENIMLSIFSLPNLSHLEIDYWMIFGVGEVTLSEALEKLKNYRKEVYLKLLINMNSLTLFEDFDLIDSSDWRHLKLDYQNLYTELIISRYSAIELSLEFLIFEHMPISILSYNVGSHEWVGSVDVGLKIDKFFRHIIDCRISNGLVVLTLEWPRPLSDVASVFIPVLEVCHNLKVLVLNLVYPANHWGVLLESLLDHRPQSLEKFKLTILDVKEEQVELFRNLGSEFENRLKTVNINFKLLVKAI